MPFEIIPHTADIRMHCSGETREVLFRDALLGMVSITKPQGGEEGQKVMRVVSLDAPDTTALLIDFLNEALSWMHTKNETYSAVHFRKFTAHDLEAELVGYVAQDFGEDIKAATYHEVEVEEDTQGGWNATVVFDI